MTKKLGSQEALRKLARAERTKTNHDRTERSKVKPARQSDANVEFSEPTFANTALIVTVLIGLGLIDFFAIKVVMILGR